MIGQIAISVAITCLGLVTYAVGQQPESIKTDVSVKWEEILGQRPEWYQGNEAVRIADNVLLYQRETGGWPKNIDMARVLTTTNEREVARQKVETDSTIDNGATYTQLVFLARVYTALKLERHKQAFEKGLDYLLEAQYANGGWPQFYPLRKGYYSHITFNDNAMINVMRLLRDIAQQKAACHFVDEGRRHHSARAVERGIELILKVQVVWEGQRTIWDAQYDATTLKPAAARAFEPVALASRESVGIVRFLMDIKQPDKPVIKAIESAIEWFEKAKLKGLRWVEKPDPSSPEGYQRVLIKDSDAGPLWARFYEIGTNRPIFVGRDSVIRYDVMEIDIERRNNYGWYSSEPVRLLSKEYPAWRKRLGL